MEIYGKEVIIIEIPESSLKPHRLQDYKDFNITSAIVPVRVNDKSIQASKEMIRILRANANEMKLHKYTIGVTEKKVFDHLEKKEIVSSYKELVIQSSMNYVAD